MNDDHSLYYPKPRRSAGSAAIPTAFEHSDLSVWQINSVYPGELILPISHIGPYR